ncbi:multidrug ABC transporter permease [Rhizobium sp. R72]|uniref:ABC transporter permease n=1 Tax=unclassified Rhizobium TaxID=2613769 RepID=UPI000B52C2C8|nr:MULTISPECIES: ABC transporter permease [unclassified Rhizobium]OWW02296.1 multidrug ABC transporter permease [Rhizobium sp. R72]OWW02430.1 multidrug ABC transporter permease [Rhizobium sp. R711]
MRQTFGGIARNARLAWDLAFRDIAARYGNSIGGPFWLIITPVSFAGIYWLVFAYFLRLKWLNPVTGAEVPYLVPLFAGLATYLLLTDVIMASLSTFRQKREYVRRAAVPIWVLWLATLMRVAVSSAVNFLVLAAMALIAGLLSLKSLIAIPQALLLVMIASVSISLFLSLLGPFFKDLDELWRILLRVLFYTSPLTYPLSTVPERFASYLWANPLTVLVEAVRNSFVFGLAPSPLSYAVTLISSLALLGAGFWLYSRLKGPIVDVV